MANQQLFRSLIGKLAPKADTVNEAGGLAYELAPRQALAQLAATGCLNATFYASAEQQLQKVLSLANAVEPRFVAQTAIWAREKGVMKDLPALLLATLSVRDRALLRAAFPRVVDSPKMLRNFVQIVRSGAVGRKSLGTVPKELVRGWLQAQDDAALFRGAIGSSPSLADVVRMVHPKPQTAGRRALYGYLLGKEHDAAALPEPVQAYERFKSAPSAGEVPDVPFQLLTALPLDREGWATIARRASWQTTRMNLSTFARHGVFDVPGMSELIAARLSDREQVRRSRVLPYQLLMAWKATKEGVPAMVRQALQDAMEVAIANVPTIEGRVVVCPDVSGSMSSPITGTRRGATTAARCIDVAALVAAAILRQNPQARVMPFEGALVDVDLDPRDTLTTNAEKLAAIGGGSTNCSAPLVQLNREKAKADLVIYVSDNQSWVESAWHHTVALLAGVPDDQLGEGASGATAMMVEWEAFRARNPRAKLVCIDLQPYGSVQAKERRDVVNVGGFSDQVFELLAEVAAGGTDADLWVRRIEQVEIN